MTIDDWNIDDIVCVRRCLLDLFGFVDLFQRLWNESPRDHKPLFLLLIFSICPFFPFVHFFHFSRVFHLSVELKSVVVVTF